MKQFISIVLLLAIHSYTLKASIGASIRLSGHVEGMKAGDKLVLMVWNRLPSVAFELPHREIITINDNGRFSFLVDSIQDYAFISLGLDSMRYKGEVVPILNQYTALKGDDVYFDIKNSKRPWTEWLSIDHKHRYYEIKCSGNGSAKYQCEYECKEKYDTYPVHERLGETVNLGTGKFNNGYGNYFSIEETNNSLSILDSIEKETFEILGNFKLKMEESAYYILRAKITGRLEFHKFNKLMAYIRYRKDPAEIKASYSDSIYQERFQKLKGEEIPSQLSALSSDYLFYVWVKLSNDLKNTAMVSDIDEGLYHYYQEKYEGGMRDYLLLNLFLFKNQYGSLSNEMERGMLTTVKDAYCQALMKDAVANMPIGTTTKLPNKVDLTDNKGNKVRLFDFKEKIVLLDFWYTGCFGCAQYFHDVISKLEERYKHNDKVVFITVNIDAMKETWEKSVSKGQYTSDAAVNLWTEGQGAEHDFIKPFKIVTYPSPFFLVKGRLTARGRGQLGTEEKIVQMIEMYMKD